MSRAVLLPYALSSVAVARRYLCADLRAAGIARSLVDDAALVLTELLVNALRHASPLPPPYPPNRVRVAWRLVCAEDQESQEDGGHWVEIAVSDGGGETLPRVAGPSVSARGGRGLGIVQQISAKWGTELDANTTTVWAMIDIPVIAVTEAVAELPRASSA
ncbi:hypothetical protein JCM3263A_21220 [Thermobifida fusca]|uniref:ATP-binding protein n=1 Tax=Thermobifida fusca TaxID=2021 RepID=UPI0006844370|nr:ATP-binding protein [Thermobifida fusca]MDD6790539.1 ATP-binding protein [Thermobifida fusca]PZN61105.1 MAG: ATP-binding protein [Thermobifida fusca]QOS59513.1 ATP-binding protein [Thermobifida fusca]